MNQDQVKENLLKLYDCEEEYTVIFSGKMSKKVNGLYKSDTREIIIHNRNFKADEAGDNLLFFTAIHELAHHIQFTEYGKKRSTHNTLFYSILDDLADKAEAMGLYKMQIGKDTQDLIDKARNITIEIADLQKRLGRVMNALYKKCEDEGLRFEDVVERKAQISRQTMKKSKQASTLDLPDDIGVDIQEAAIQAKSEEKREAIIHAGQSGKSVDQAKRAITAPPPEEDETVTLVKEKQQIERKIERLTRRLEEVEEQLVSKGEL